MVNNNPPDDLETRRHRPRDSLSLLYVLFVCVCVCACVPTQENNTLIITVSFKLLHVPTARVFSERGLERMRFCLLITFCQMVMMSAVRLGSVEVTPLRIGPLTFTSSVRPLLPGHVIVAPKRCVAKVEELTNDEYDDIFKVVAAEQKCARREDSSITAFNIAIKDGAGSGQPVPHAHAHVVPRRPGDLARNDDVYGLLDTWTPSADIPSCNVPLDLPDDDKRSARTQDEMAEEAERYREDGETVRAVPVKFGRFDLDSRQVFYSSEHCIAIVNLKPLVPGHVLVVSRRVVPVLSDLTDDEALDLWRSTRHVANLVCRIHQKPDANLAVQDGRDAGQSVPHVHVHVLPRAATR